MTRRIVGLAAALIGMAPSIVFGAQDGMWQVVRTNDESCHNGLHTCGTGPFATIVSCEDALGSYLGVLFVEPMGGPRNGGWSVSNRYWHGASWGDDVTSYVWGMGGTQLYVATSGAYGAGAVYALNLQQRSARRLLPRDARKLGDDIVYHIESVDRLGQTAEIREDSASVVRRFRIRL